MQEEKLVVRRGRGEASVLSVNGQILTTARRSSHSPLCDSIIERPGVIVPVI